VEKIPVAQKSSLNHPNHPPGAAVRVKLRVGRERELFAAVALKLYDNLCKGTQEVSDGMWQCKRSPSCFSSDGGRTYYDNDDQPPRWWIRRLFGRYKKMRRSAEPAK
jgi:hypothetical protein